MTDTEVRALVTTLVADGDPAGMKAAPTIAHALENGRCWSPSTRRIETSSWRCSRIRLTLSPSFVARSPRTFPGGTDRQRVEPPQGSEPRT